MANLDEKKLREEISKGKIRSIYFLVSEDPERTDFLLRQLQLKIFGDASKNSIERYYGDDLNPASLMDSMRSSSLWEPNKLILVKQAERITAKQYEALMPLLSEDFERSTLVFLSTKIDARTKFAQALQKAKDQAVLVKFEELSAGEWNLFIQQYLRDLGKDLDDNARALLQDWTLSSLSELKHTLERAALYAGEAKTITKEHITAVGMKITPEDIFRFTGGILAGDSTAALSMLDNLLEQGEEPIALVALLARQYRWLLRILALRAEGKTDSSIASECRIFPAAAKVLFPASKRLGGKGVIRGLSVLSAADYSLKISKISSRHILTRLITDLSC